VDYYAQKLIVDKERNVVLKIEQFAKSGKLIKQTTLTDVEKIQGKWIAKTMYHQDTLRVGNKTKTHIQEAQFDISIPESTFSKENLK